MKKWLFVFLILVVCLILSATAEEKNGTYNPRYYDYILLDDGTVEIVGYTGREKELRIPDNLRGFTVTSIGERAFDGCYTLKSVMIPESITSIGDYAFSSCEALASVVIPDSVINMGANPFMNCENLNYI